MSLLRHIYRVLLLTIVLFLNSCSRLEHPLQEGNATLSVKVEIPQVNIDVKNVSSSPSDPTNWTAWERSVDGRYLYRVTAFLLQGERLVASKDLTLTGEPSVANINFEGNFTHGSYRLMVVANYSAHQADDGENGIRSYSGLEDFTATVESILDQDDIADFTTAYGSDFMKYQLASNGGICAKVPQALSLVKDIELKPGTNTVEGELIRTYSRIRISLENHSDQPLDISAIAFSDIFTQNKAYLFSNNGYIQDRTSLDIDNTDALTPFTATSDNPLTIPGKGTATIFDAYILESQKVSTDEEYSYTLSLGYEGTGEYTLSGTTAIRRLDNVASGYYLIYNTNSSRYLTAGSNTVETGTLSTLTEGMTVPKEYVWTFDNNGLSADNYYIGTSEAMSTGQTAYYMNTPSNSSVTLVSNKSSYFSVDEDYTGYYFNRQYYITLRGMGSDNRYLSVSNNTVSGRTRINNSTYFYLYPVAVPNSSSSSFNVPLATIDDSTGQAEDVEQIRRNDFIDAVVLVRYNKSQGHFYFEVKDWNSAGGDVEFD